MIKRLESKNEKSAIKKIIKRNQVVVLALALMLMTAGYMNYTNNHGNENLILAQLGDAKLVSANVVEKSENIIENTEQENVNVGNTIKEEINKTNNIMVENKVETKNENKTELPVSTDIQKNEDDYFSQSKIEREKMYSQMLETYEGILENDKIPSEQKSVAENEIKNINNNKNAIMIVENLLKTKGFENAVVFINDESINVVVKSDKLETAEVAQIQNIVQRELKKEIENIHITTK